MSFGVEFNIVAIAPFNFDSYADDQDQFVWDVDASTPVFMIFRHAVDTDLTVGFVGLFDIEGDEVGGLTSSAVFFENGQQRGYSFLSSQQQVGGTVSGDDVSFFNMRETDVGFTAANLVSTVTAGEGDDTLVGGARTDQFSGMGGDDDISGLKGDDMIAGGFGDDMLNGGGGRDMISPGGGRNKVKGGLGKDVFDFDEAESRTFVRDYESGRDIIDLSDVVWPVGFPPTLNTLAEWFPSIDTLADDTADRLTSREIDWWEKGNGDAVLTLGDDFKIVFNKVGLSDIYVEDILI